MATILPDEQKKKPNSFGDAAAASGDSGVTQVAAPAVAANPVGLGAVPKTPAAPLAASPGAVPAPNLGAQGGNSFGDAAAAAGDASVTLVSAPTQPGLGAVPKAPALGAAAPAVTSNPGLGARMGNSFGDPAPAEPGLGIRQIGSASIPAPLPMLTASLPPSPQAVQMQKNEAAAASPVPGGAAAPVTALAPQQTGAAFGIYPNPNSRLSSHANDAALARGVVATGPAAFQAAAPLSVAPLRMNNLTDPRSLEYAGGAVPKPNPVAASVQPSAAATAALPAVAPLAAPAVANTVPAVVSTPTSTAAPAAAPAVGLGARANMLGSLADTNDQLAALQASNAAVPRGGVTEVNAGFGARNAAFNDDAALRTAGARGSWSPRRGFQGDATAVQAAMVPVANRQRMNEVGVQSDTAQSIAAAREAGDTVRLGIRERGEQGRAAAIDRRFGAQDALNREEFGLKKITAEFDGRSRARIEAAQKEVQNATTPEARRAASEKLSALNGKATQDNFAAIETGGGTEPIDPANPMLGVRSIPKQAVIYNKATGAIVPNPTAAAPTPALPPGMVKQVGTANGKPVYEDASGKRFGG